MEIALNDDGRDDADGDGTDAGAGVSIPRILDRQALEFASDAHILSDPHGLILEANLAAAGLLDCSKMFVLGKPLGLFVAQGLRGRFYECLARLNTAAGSDEFEAWLGRREPEHFVHIRVSVSAGAPEAERMLCWHIRDLTEFRRVEADRERLLRELVTAQEDERRRVARELHDSFGQLLTALLLKLRTVREACRDNPGALAPLEDVQRVADELGRASHELAVRLRPTALDDVGLCPALQRYLEDWSAASGVEVRFQGVGIDANRLPTEVESALYRVVQEALTNVARHARAPLVSVVVERQNGRAVAVVEDHGVGFDPDTVGDSGRLGLIGMRERMSLLDGRLLVESAPGRGTTISAQVPLKPRASPG